MKNLLLLLLFIPQFIFSQSLDSLNIDMCYNLAISNYPLNQGKALLSQSNLEKTLSLDANFLPQVIVGGQATYQSDVTAVNLPPNFPINIPSPSKDQYKLYVDVNENLYDGGLTQKQKLLEYQSMRADSQQIEVDLYQLKDRINTVYFNILLLQENEKLLALVVDEIEKRLVVVESGFRNGASLESDVAVLKAEKLKTEQQVLEIQIRKIASIQIMGKYINARLPVAIGFKMPDGKIKDAVSLRPELMLFDLQKQKIDVSKDLLTAKKMPKLTAFAEAGYGRPALNMFKDDFQTYYIFGARFSWNIFDWNQNNHDKQVLSYTKQIVETQKQTFNQNIDIALQNSAAAILRLEKMIEKDIEIINLRNKITKMFASQLENGVINSTEYINQLNAETQAEINLQTHKIQLLQEKINYTFIRGN